MAGAVWRRYKRAMTKNGYRQIGIVGAGRVAQALALGLGAHSAAPVMLWGRSPDRLESAVKRAGRTLAAELETLVGACDLIGIAVSDDALGSVAVAMAAAMPRGRAPFVFHVSGRSGAALLDPLRAVGALTAAIHPVMTFTGDPGTEVQRMSGARFAITGADAEAKAAARDVVCCLGGVGVDIAEAHRPLYHAALCHAANHLVTLLEGSFDALRGARVDDPAGLLAPLVRAALENSLGHGLSALSGPLLRGDEETIAGHLEALAGHRPEILPPYRAMALATLDALERSGASVPPALRARLDQLRG
ncbi:Rossmann-like and DUF2520 domain-containing protein [Sphingopyxis flava]|uniref:Predicted oxidoreductase, contains short-chain dehydrogenase (SDR) and DUF2520 domains n=1 Tax=Sphingopyxis flava TaxID=1507287 RepID=A0A1T5APM8_9SPHN|nr:Predicted oxidoreductase, contains short-chain dehydrogenase (SDR) and DUF2520 domains [Sphingopyxis flava]